MNARIARSELERFFERGDCIRITTIVEREDTQAELGVPPLRDEGRCEQIAVACIVVKFALVQQGTEQEVRVGGPRMIDQERFDELDGLTSASCLYCSFSGRQKRAGFRWSWHVGNGR